MRLRRSTVEHPFATLKYRIFGQGRPRFLLRGIANVLGGGRLRAALAG
jgi:transposase